VCVRVCMHLSIYLSIYIKHTHARTHTHIYIYTLYVQHTHTHTHTDTHVMYTWLYLAVRSPRQGAPVLIWPVPRPTTRSAMVVSSVSPDLCVCVCVCVRKHHTEPSSCAMHGAGLDYMSLSMYILSRVQIT